MKIEKISDYQKSVNLEVGGMGVIAERQINKELSKHNNFLRKEIEGLKDHIIKMTERQCARCLKCGRKK